MTKNEIYRQLTTSAEVLLFIYACYKKEFRLNDLKFQQEFLDKGVRLDTLRRAIKKLIAVGVLEKSPAPHQYQLTDIGKNLTPTPLS
ncbi:MAG: hypothetical protein J0H29_13315 [Sphingobacteriales bacterium]|nr:hypothetical protein [Sphingobacteriales bacterium]OJY86357.1 MAG: hypothetical protein BGP14_20495 [Sphingobacteriales bacterium 44-15]